MTALLQMVREAIRAVPAMRYAMAVVGVLAVSAIALSLFSNRGQTAALVSAFVLFAMVFLVIFARVATLGGASVSLAAQVVLWTVTASFTLGVGLIFSALISQRPEPIARLLGLLESPVTSATSWQAHFFNIDQSAELFVNDIFVTKATYGDNHFVDITRQIKPGANKLELVVSNIASNGAAYPGVTYGIELRHGERVVKNVKCGAQSISYCPNLIAAQLPLHVPIEFDGR